jgi:hypothetical protein
MGFEVYASRKMQTCVENTDVRTLDKAPALAPDMMRANRLVMGSGLAVGPMTYSPAFKVAFKNRLTDCYPASCSLRSALSRYLALVRVMSCEPNVSGCWEPPWARGLIWLPCPPTKGALSTYLVMIPLDWFCPRFRLPSQSQF